MMKKNDQREESFPFCETQRTWNIILNAEAQKNVPGGGAQKLKDQPDGEFSQRLKLLQQ